VAADVWLWKQSSKYQNPNDWIFASPHVDGEQPFWPDIVLQKIIRPAAVRAGIRKRIGWHTFRHTYSTLLKANGEDVKTVQELLRQPRKRRSLYLCRRSPLTRISLTSRPGSVEYPYLPRWLKYILKPLRQWHKRELLPP